MTTASKMPKDLKEKWLAALRSGMYEQGRAALFDGQGYCCLGVLQAVAEGGVETLSGQSLKYPSVLWSKNNHCFSDDSDEVVNRGFDPVVPYHRSSNWVSHLNDERVPFSVIADLIEEHVEGV